MCTHANHFGGCDMAMEWTDFPERVELFGDLFSIYETLDQHRAFDFECFPDHPERAAYSVERDGGQWVIVLRPDRMPGVQRLLNRLEREGQCSLTLDRIREFRRRAATALYIEPAAVNALTITEVADALEEADAAARPTPTVTTLHSANP